VKALGSAVVESSFFEIYKAVSSTGVASVNDALAESNLRISRVWSLISANREWRVGPVFNLDQIKRGAFQVNFFLGLSNRRCRMSASYQVDRTKVVKNGVLAGVAGGGAEILWIIAVAALTNISAVEVSRRIGGFLRY
jgi:hypothetical protein